METVIRKTEKKDYCLLGLLVVIFILLLLFMGERHDFPDSLTYSTMSPDVSFGYPFFLWIFRCFFGETRYYFWVALFQNVFAAWCIWNISVYIKKFFRLNLLLEILVMGIFIVPFVATSFLTTSGMVITNSIVTEGLTVAGYLLLTKFLLCVILEQKGTELLWGWLTILLLVLLRPQMIIPAIIFFGVTIYYLCKKPRLRAILICIAGVVLFIAINLGGNHIYRTYFSSEQKENSLNTLTLLTNIIYASKEQDSEHMTADAAELYDLIFEKIKAEEANYQFAPSGLLNRATHLEEYHDAIKLPIIYPTMYGYFYFNQGIRGENVITEKIIEYAEYYEVYLIKQNWKTWVYDYFSCSMLGLIRTNSIDSSFLIAFSILMYIIYIIFTVIIFRKKYTRSVFRFAILTGIMILVNAFGVSTTIMCLSRYMIYNMSLFYVVMLLQLRLIIKNVCVKDDRKSNYIVTLLTEEK